MVKYFNELNKIDDFKVYVTHNNRYDIDNREVTLDFYKNYYQIFQVINEVSKIDEIKLLRETSNITDLKEKCLKQFEILEVIKDKYQADPDKLYNLVINRRFDKIMSLLNKIDTLGTRDLNSIIVLYYYIIDIIDPFHDKSVLNTFKMALKELNEKDNKAIYGKEINVVSLPNYWYILPDFHELDQRLYNTTGDVGHKEANILYPYCKALNGVLLNPKDFIDKVKDIEANGVSFYDYMNYVGYGIDYLPSPLDRNDEKSHMQNNIKATTGSIMAQGLLWEYFDHINKISKDYPETLEVFKKIVLDDFLIRLLGFHKVIMRDNRKIIATSNLDYEDEFAEYESNGWNIDFTTPLKYDYKNNRIKEEDDSFVKMKQFHID